MLRSVSLLAVASQAVSQFVADDETLALFRNPCHDDTYCQLECLVDGPNANDDPEYYFCSEPDSCDITAPRSFDGMCNNVNEGRRLRGSRGHTQLVRIEESFVNVQSPRVVSDVIGAFEPTIPNTFGGSTAQVMFGQFIDHDFTIIHLEATESLIIPGSGDVPDMLFQPSEAVGEDPAYHINDLTAYIDLSQVYGSDNFTNGLLRFGANRGELASRFADDGKEYLPFVTQLPDEATETAALAFLPGSMAGGDVRANEHLTLNAWHTLFLREHNRYARLFGNEDPTLSDDDLFQEARRWNIAQYQNIVFHEYFEAWHDTPLPAYSGYDDTLSPDLDVWFSTASYRFGHSGVPNMVGRIDEEGNDNSMLLGEVFFRPSLIEDNGGVDALLKGAVRQCHERIDTYFQEGLRNALFNDIPGLAGSPAMDLYSLNVARGRDHSLGSYPAALEFFGLPVPQTFDAVTGGRECVTSLLEQLYGVDAVDACDPFVCGLAEPATQGELGQLFYNSQLDHFTRLRDADRFYFENMEDGAGFSADEIATIRSTSLADIIARNTFMQNTDPTDDENYIGEAFQTDRCCRFDGNPEGDMSQMCVPNGDSDQYTLMTELDECLTTEAVRAGEAFFPGSPECTCDCNCAVARALAGTVDAEATLGGLPMAAMIGIIVGVSVCVICVCVLGWVLYKRRKEAQELDYMQSDHMSMASGAAPVQNNFAQQQFAQQQFAHTQTQQPGYAASVHSQAPSVNNYF